MTKREDPSRLESPTSDAPRDLETLRVSLRDLINAGDEESWPEEAVRAAVQAGCFRAAVPTRFGGDGLTSTRRVDLYEAVAFAGVSLALILTQHDGACELLTDCDHPELAETVLSAAAKGQLLGTIGISQLTTSHQGGTPALRATLDERRPRACRLNGFMPWVTGADRADFVVTGAVTEDGQQVLVYLPLDTPGLRIDPPFKLMALTDSRTCQIHCRDVEVPPEYWMRGPSPQALARRSPVKSLTVSSVALGMAGRLIDEIEATRDRREETLQPWIDQARARYHRARERVRDAASWLEDAGGEVPSLDIRAEMNDLVTRLAVTYLILAKGSGYRADRVAQRLVREALFFLVWSAPTPLRRDMLEKIWRNPS